MTTTSPTPGQPTAKIVQLSLPTVPKADKSRAETKYGAAVMKIGYTVLPSLLLRGQAKLELSSIQMNVLIQLIEHWWVADKNPHPAKETIARRMQKSPRQIQRILTQLEQSGFIVRCERFNGLKSQTSNEYDLTGLVRKLKAIEPDFKKEAEQKRIRQKKVEAPKTGVR